MKVRGGNGAAGQWGIKMEKLLYLVGMLFIGSAVLAYPQIQSAIHQILVGLDFGFGFMIFGMGAIVQAIKKSRTAA
jgi:hypothetical protein